MGPVKVRIARSDYGYGWVMIFYYEEGGKRYVAAPVELDFKEVSGSVPVPATLAIWDPENEISKAIMRGLSEMGTKLEDQSRTAGLLEATERHLGDMRRLVFERKKGG